MKIMNSTIPTTTKPTLIVFPFLVRLFFPYISIWYN